MTPAANFTDGETEAGRGEVTGQRPHSPREPRPPKPILSGPGQADAPHPAVLGAVAPECREQCGFKPGACVEWAWSPGWFRTAGASLVMCPRTMSCCPWPAVTTSPPAWRKVTGWLEGPRARHSGQLWAPPAKLQKDTHSCVLLCCYLSARHPPRTGPSLFIPTNPQGQQRRSDQESEENSPDSEASSSGTWGSQDVLSE